MSRVSVNVNRSVGAIQVGELIRRLQNVQKVYPDSVVVLDEMNSSLDVYKVLNNGGATSFITQVLIP